MPPAASPDGAVGLALLPDLAIDDTSLGTLGAALAGAAVTSTGLGAGAAAAATVCADAGEEAG